MLRSSHAALPVGRECVVGSSAQLGLGGSLPFRSFGLLREPTEPLPEELVQDACVQLIHAAAAALLHSHQAGLLKDTEMARCGRPATREARGNFTCTHASAPEVQNHQNLAA
jgi:hypothetical protein